MAEPKKKDLLKCKTMNDIRRFAANFGLTLTQLGTTVWVGQWECMVTNDQLKYVK